MTISIAPESRALLSLAAAIVPRDLRADWLREWEGEIWWWTHSRTHSGNSPIERLALLRHCTGAIVDSVHLRVQEEELLPSLREVLGRPAACLAALTLVLALLAAYTSGFRHTRRALAGASFPATDRLALISESGPFMGAHIGVPPSKVDIWGHNAPGVEGAAVYVWYHSIIASPSAKPRELPAAKVGDSFFSLLGIRAPLCPDCVVLSYDFWKRELGEDRHAIGRIITVDNRPARVSAILPRDFWFLDSNPAVWTLYESGKTWAEHPKMLMGAICRLKPGVTLYSAANTMRQVAASTQPHTITLDPLDSIIGRPLTILGPAWLTIVLIALMAAVAVWLTAPGFPWFFTAKSLLALVLVLLATIEFGAARFTTATGGTDFAAGAGSLWLLATASLLALFWSWSDQRKRCRTCLVRLSMPVCIGNSGRTLLEESGTELVCLEGHGMLFTSAGPAPEVRWASLETSWRGACKGLSILMLVAVAIVSNGCSKGRAQAHPVFTGQWELLSATGTIPPEGLTLDIRQATSVLQVKTSWQPPPDGRYGLTLVGLVTPLARFTTEGMEDLNQVGPFALHSRTHWDGSALVTTWSTSEFQGVSFHGTWTRALSATGRHQTLAIAADSSRGEHTSALLSFRRVNE